MEFTPKKQPLSTVNASAVRHNPYASGGRQFIWKYKQNRSSSILVTPPRTNGYRRFNTRSDRIVSSSKSRSVDKKSPARTPVKGNASLAPKRPFQAVNAADGKDPYSIFTDSDEENQSLARTDTKSQTVDKENQYQSSEDSVYTSAKKERKPIVKTPKDRSSIFDNPKPKSLKVYSNKRKPLFVTKSKLVSDISPQKVERYCAAKSPCFVAKSPPPSAEKENIPTQSVADSSSSALSPHLIGFPNYGNTCYLNSVLQSLLGLPTFLSDYKLTAAELVLNHASLFYGLDQVLKNRMKGQASGVKDSLRTVKENLERIDCSFSGFKMQDANEFLTKVLDTVKDEIDRCYANWDSRGASTSKTLESRPSTSIEDVDEEVFLSGARTNGDCTRVLNLVSKTEGGDLGLTDDEIVKCTEEIVKCPGGNSAVAVDELNCEGPETVRGTLDCNLQSTNIEVESQPANGLRNPVKDNFEFQLLESYRCQGCGEVEGRKQSYFGLYVNLPENGGDTIQDAITRYMSVDERELTCEKCGHNTSSVVTTITKLPRILIIQLKRYEYDPEQSESIKMSSKVLVNRWISLQDYMTNDVDGPCKWNPDAGNSVLNPRQGTLSVRNLSSELNKCNTAVEEDELPSVSPAKPIEAISSVDEDEELQLVMRRSMEEVQGGQEEDEIQQAIRLSLQEMGMSYAQENLEDGEQEAENENTIAVEENGESQDHAYCLISIISHFGLTTNTGHYVSDVYNCEEESWFHYDDESVAKISESVVFAEGRQKNGYIFFYMHKDLFEESRKKEKR